jgi:hypothetical protein
MRQFAPFLSLLVASHVLAVTVYNQQPLADQTNTASPATYTGAAAYDPTVLTPPPVPDGFVTQLSLSLSPTSNNLQGLSPPLKGSFLGFSIEFSVINQVSECPFFLHFSSIHSFRPHAVGINS